MLRALAFWGIAVSGIALAGTAMAGVVITTQNGGGNGKPETNTMLIDTDRLKMANGDGGIIYRGDLQKVWMLHGEDHSYREMDPQSMKQMQSQIAAAMQRMQQQMASMPPEQRQRMQAMMAQRGIGAPGTAAQPPQIKYEKTGPAKKVGQWSCTPYRVTMNGANDGEMCVAKLSDVGITADDIKALSGFGAFMSQMAPGGNRGGQGNAFDVDGLSKAVGFEGIPVQTTHYSSDGAIDMQNTIVSVDHKSIPKDTFDLPAGYTKQEMPMGPPRGGQ